MDKSHCCSSIILILSFVSNCYCSEVVLPASCERGLRSQEDKYTNCSGSGRLDKILEQGARFLPYEIVFAKKSPLIKYEQYGDGSGGTPPLSLVFCKGARYSFSLNGNGSKEKFIPVALSTEEIKEVNSAIGFNLKTFLSASYSIGGVPVVSLLADPGFSISSIDENYQGTQATRVLFSIDAKDSGEIVFLPQKNWVVQSFRKADSRGLVTSGKVVYDDEDNLLNVEFCRGKGSLDSPTVIQRFTFDFEKLNFSTPSDKEFTLTHYRLVEPILSDRH